MCVDVCRCVDGCNARAVASSKEEDTIQNDVRARGVLLEPKIATNPEPSHTSDICREPMLTLRTSGAPPQGVYREGSTAVAFFFWGKHV